ncbi:hypothetical protein LTS17_003704 [Exophiala oligosperma]
MLMLKLQCRFYVVAVILFLFFLSFFLDTDSELNLPLAFRQNPQAWIYSGPEAEDKAVIIAKIQSDDVSWVFEHLPDWKQAIYYMTEPTEGKLHPPLNKGREAMAYLTFLIDHYNQLPAYMVFVHPHLEGWPKAWHTDSPDHNQVLSIRSLRLEYLEQQGYVNMRCIHDPGCPAEIQVDRQEDHRTTEHAMRDAWPYMFGGNYTDIPKIIAEPCCSQFAVSKKQVLKRTKSEYEHYRQWLLDTPLDDDTTGRVFEYLWHVIFGREAVHCPPVEQCWCEQFGRC